MVENLHVGGSERGFDVVWCRVGDRHSVGALPSRAHQKVDLPDRAFGFCVVRVGVQDGLIRVSRSSEVARLELLTCLCQCRVDLFGFTGSRRTA
ncbi:hypothetical protein I552_0964 [Mycobacterium xenopi 3993]|nr:hypothetical protein I552_0964 [Mycobacterium xenopi 3993]